MNYVKSTSFSAMVEGSPLRSILDKRGVQQGDPFSPLLFVIILDYLVRLTKVVKDKRFELYINGGATVEPIIAFANNVAFFIKASRKLLKTIGEILEEFCKFY